MDAHNIVETHRWWLGITAESWLTIMAVVVGPILALLAQRVLDNLREDHNRQVRVFRELMITRTQRLSARHVEALNAIPLEFKGWRDKDILTAWKAYLTHLGTDSTKDLDTWVRTGGELLVALLYLMSHRLGPKLEKLEIEREVYLPQVFNLIENEQRALLQQLIELTDGTGRRKLPIAAFDQSFPDIRAPKAD